MHPNVQDQGKRDSAGIFTGGRARLQVPYAYPRTNISPATYRRHPL